MSRFCLIDLWSGFVWGVVDAESPIEAARTLDSDISPGNGRSYHEAARPEHDSGYAVHLAPDGFDVTDGQDPAEIDRADALPLAGFIHWQEGGDA